MRQVSTTGGSRSETHCQQLYHSLICSSRLLKSFRQVDQISVMEVKKMSRKYELL